MLSFPFCNRTTQLFPQQLYYYTPPDFISWSSSSPLPPSPPMLLAENQEYYYYTIYFALLMCSFVLQPKWRRGPRTQTYVSNIASSKTCRESTLLSREKDRKRESSWEKPNYFSLRFALSVYLLLLQRCVKWEYFQSCVLFNRCLYVELSWALFCESQHLVPYFSFLSVLLLSLPVTSFFRSHSQKGSWRKKCVYVVCFLNLKNMACGETMWKP